MKFNFIEGLKVPVGSQVFTAKRNYKQGDKLDIYANSDIDINDGFSIIENNAILVMDCSEIGPSISVSTND